MDEYKIYEALLKRYSRKIIDRIKKYSLSSQDCEDLIEHVINEIKEEWYKWKKNNPKISSEENFYKEIHKELPDIIDQCLRVYFKIFPIVKAQDVVEPRLFDSYYKVIRIFKDFLSELGTDNKEQFEFLCLEFLVIAYWEKHRKDIVLTKTEFKQSIEYRRKLFFFLTYYFTDFRSFILDLMKSQNKSDSLDIKENNKAKEVADYFFVFETLVNTIDNDRKEFKKSIMKDLQRFLEENVKDIEIENIIKKFMKLRFDWE